MNFRTFLRAAAAFLIAISCLLFAGCPNNSASVPAKKVPTAPPPPLTVLVVDDASLGQAIAREWRGRTEEDLTVRDVSLAEIAAAGRLPGDAIVFPSGMIGQLAESGLISPLESTVLEDADFNYRDIFDQIRLGEMRWGARTLATPLGSPQLLLVYRADVLEKQGLIAPADWTEFQQIAQRLHADSAASDQPVTLEPLADGWSGQLLLARAASYAMHREQISPLFRLDNMAPLIDQPPYVRALEELVTAAKAGGYTDQRLSPARIFEQVRSGRCTMAIAWPAPDLAASRPTDSDAKLRFAMLPSSREAYRFATKTWEPRGEGDVPHVAIRSISGRMAAVSASSSDARRAQGFVVWLAGRDVSPQVSQHSAATTLFRQSQIASAGRWTASLSPDAGRQYAEVLSHTLSLPRGFGLTLPGRLEYLNALDEAVRQALDDKPAAEALAEAAKKWNQITEKIGRDAQIRANARSFAQGDR